MSEYTPTEARICIDFCNAATKRARPDGSFMSMEEADAAFSRWLAAHDAEVREEANWIIARIVSAANKGPLEGEDGFIWAYQMAVGPIHAAIPFLQKQGIVVTTAGEIRGLEITETEAGRIAERTLDAINQAGGLSQHIENLKREDAAVRAGVVTEEPEWEYGWKSHFPDGEEYEWLACDSREDAERQIRSNQDVEQVSPYEDDERLTFSLWKRTKSKAGPWVPVEQGDET